ncbi:importin subunit alpha-1 isoform X1 [Hydra vulgaris]|uniref:Importin subunit alpha n=1 Tax=Hydra vulgaris TaxID=6087 RepID=T2MFS8_HYDVU|nr:importin subunit alpha-1 [Hydra vulgaris]
MPSQENVRSREFKNRGKDISDFRRRKNDVTVEIRKARKDEQMLKKRNVGDLSEISPLKENNQQIPTALLHLDEIVTILLSKITPTDISKFENDIYQAVQSTRRLLSRENNPPIDRVIKAGLVPPLVQLLKYEQNSNIQFEAAWAVTNIASGNSDQTQTVVEAGAVDFFIALLHSSHVNVCEQAVWALGNIAGDGPQFRDFVISRGVVKPLLALVNLNTPHSFLRNVTWTLSNLCRNKNPPPKLEEIQNVLPVLAQLISHVDKDVVADACWALSYLTDGPNEKIDIIIQTGVVPHLVELLQDSNVNIVTPALRAIGNIVTGDDFQTQTVVECGALNYLRKLFLNPKSQIVKEAAWAVSNIAAGNQSQIQAIIDSDLLGPVINALEKGDFKVQKETVWVITNYTSGGSVEQIVQLINAGVIAPLCRMLTTQDSKTTMVALDAVNNILLNAQRMNAIGRIAEMIEECGGVDILERLQTHENDSIQKTASDLIEQYFSEQDDDVEEKLVPLASDTAYQFGPASSTSQSHFTF